MRERIVRLESGHVDSQIADEEMLLTEMRISPSTRYARLKVPANDD